MATRATKFFEKKIVVESETTVVDTSKRPRRRPTTVCRLARSLLTSTTLSWRLSNTFSIVFPFQSSVRGCFGCLAESWSAPVPTRGLLCRKAYRVEMKIKILKWKGVASWHWKVNDDCCGICRQEFDACCPDCKAPGDDCPPVWGKCTHPFHMHCIVKWLKTQSAREQCPMCRQDWQFGEFQAQGRPRTQSD